MAITYGYQDFPKGTDEAKALTKILDDAWAKDIRYMTNQDMSANPRVDQWSNGTDPAAELTRMMAIRKAALGRFGEQSIKNGRAMAEMEEVLVPLYLYHRYQVEAAASAVGGMHYIYALRGDGRQPTRPVPANEQRAALHALMATIQAVRAGAAGLGGQEPAAASVRLRRQPRAVPAEHRADVRRHRAGDGRLRSAPSRCSSTTRARPAWSNSTRSTRRCRGWTR